MNGMSTPEDERQSRSGSTRRTGAERPMFRSQLTLTLRGVVLIAVCNETDLGLFNICGGEVVLLVIAPRCQRPRPCIAAAFASRGRLERVGTILDFAIYGTVQVRLALWVSLKGGGAEPRNWSS